MQFTITTNIDPGVLLRLSDVMAAMGNKSGQLMHSVTRDVATRMRELAIGQTPVGEKPKPIVRKTRASTPDEMAHMKARWEPVVSVDGGFAFNNPASYGYVLEYGLYPNPGKRTVGSYYMGQSDSWNAYGVFSNQAPHGILGPLTVGNQADDAANYIITEMLTAWEKFKA